MKRDRKQEADIGSFESWLSMQKDMQAGLEAALRARLGREPDMLARYRRRFEAEFPAWTGRALKPAELAARLRGAEIILMGDFHSLPQSQRSALRLLRLMVRSGQRPALGLEMLPSAAQAELDAYQNGALPEEDFLRIFRRYWDFPWHPLRTLLAFARHHALEVIALNSDPTSSRGVLAQRDRAAARLIMQARRRDPGRPVVVLFGDYHLADSHLPAALSRLTRGRAPRLLRVFQNREPLYWESLEHLGQEAEILDLEGGDLCLQSATPLVKLQSWQYWLTLCDEEIDPDLPGFVDPGELVEDLSVEVNKTAERIASFLSIPRLTGPSARVYWVGSPAFASRIATEEDWTREERQIVGSALKHGDGAYLRERNLAVLDALTQNRIAEMAARIIHQRSARIATRPRGYIDDFYLRVFSSALPFLGSKLINPLRKYRDVAGLRRLLSERSQGNPTWQRRARLLLEYLECEDELIARGDSADLPTDFFHLDVPSHIALTRAIGRQLGGKLWEAMMLGDIDRLTVRELFFEPFHLEGSPLRRYLDVLEMLGGGQAWQRHRRRRKQRL